MTTVGVAWACALWSPLTAFGDVPSEPRPEDGWFGTSQDRGFGYSREVEWTGKFFGEDVFAAWRGAFVPVRDAGWPMRSMRSVVRAYHDPADRFGPALAYPALPAAELVRRGYPTDKLPAWLGAKRWRRVPLVPRAVGFGVDSAAFACAWWVGLAVPPAVVRRRRRRAGRCVACGYGIGGLATCPECGVAA